MKLMKGYEVIEKLKDYIDENDIIVGSTGNISREVFHILDQPQVYLRGSLGLQMSVGLGIALEEKKRKIIVILGDGSFLMGMSSIVTSSYYKPSNLKILILDNAEYYTTGGQKTVSSAINFTKLLKSVEASFKRSKNASEESINQDLSDFFNLQGFSILHLNIESGKKPLANIPWHPEEITKRMQKKIS
nr:Sulfopyruvate decarboxylase subunit beta [Candidatus Prometheoarchaeum syntrophicum]